MSRIELLFVVWVIVFQDQNKDDYAICQESEKSMIWL